MTKWQEGIKMGIIDIYILIDANLGKNITLQIIRK